MGVPSGAGSIGIGGLVAIGGAGIGVIGVVVCAITGNASAAARSVRAAAVRNGRIITELYPLKRGCHAAARTR